MSATEQQAQDMAAEFRRQHHLGVQPLGDLVALIEQTTGYDVAVLDADADEHGLTMRDPLRNRAFIGVARTQHPMRQRSTLAHELAHLLFDDHAEDLGERSMAEVRADAFARHFLVPGEGLRGVLGGGLHEQESALSEVVQRFLVSPAMASIAMRDIGAISPMVARSWQKLGTPYIAARHGWSDHYVALQQDSNRVRAPQGLLSRAMAGFEAGVIGIQTLATLRAVPVEEIEQELADLGIVPRELDITDIDTEDLPDSDVDLDGPESEGPET